MQVKCRLSTRGYELDPDGLVPPPVFLRYLEHMRWESLREDPSMGQLFQGGHSMVVVAQQLIVEREIGLAAALRGVMWVSAVGTTSLTLEHQLRLERGDELVVSGTTVGVYLGPDGKSCSLPGELRPDVDRAPGAALPRLRERPPSGSWTRTFAVRHSDLDLQRHVNQANYLAFIGDTRLLAAAAGAYGPGEAGPDRRLRTAHIEYHRQALAGDRLTATTWARDRGQLVFVLSRDEATICNALITLGRTAGKSQEGFGDLAGHLQG